MKLIKMNKPQVSETRDVPGLLHCKIEYEVKSAKGRLNYAGPKFTPDGRYVFFASRDGWVTKYDLWNLKTVAEVRAGINTRNIANIRASEKTIRSFCFVEFDKRS